MKVNFKNLGVLKDATVDLNKKLIVFCGPNNTGKTYVSYAIYGIVEGLRDQLPHVKDVFSPENLLELIDKRNITINLNLDGIFDYRELSIEFKDNLNSLYGVSESEAKKLLKDAEVKFDITKERFEETVLSSEFSLEKDWGFMKLKFVKKANTNELSIELIKLREGSSELFFAGIIGGQIRDMIIKYPTLGAHIFPVERNSIYTFSKELSVKRNMLIDEMQKVADSKRINPFDWVRRRSTRYPLPIRDGLEIAEDMVNYQKEETEFADFANEIEAEILNGKVVVSKDGEVLFIPNKAKGKKLPIHLSASLVKTLSSVIFYLKHLAKSSDLIIIDEPELNLHPNNQVILTRIFAKLINRGFRVLISTHSDYVIREINNLIMLSGVKDKKIIKELGYSGGESLKVSDVGAYLFKYHPKPSSHKTIATPLEVTYEGFDVDSIDETINKLNDRSMKLYQYISEQEILEENVE